MALINNEPGKCSILNLDTKTELKAHFNPTELSIDKSVPWKEHDSSKGDNPVLEFTKSEPLELGVELLFDTYESRDDVYTKYVKVLQSFTHVIESKKRPAMCRFGWGKFPEFKGVITSLSTKYTMFFNDGTPCRATCTIKMKQAEKVKLGEVEGTSGGAESRPGRTVQQGDEMRADKLGDDHRKVLDESGSEDGRLRAGEQAPTQDTQQGLREGDPALLE